MKHFKEVDILQKSSTIEEAKYTHQITELQNKLIILQNQLKNVVDFNKELEMEIEKLMLSNTKALAQINELREAITLKDMFISTLSNDLIEPLDTMTGFFQIMFNQTPGLTKFEIQEFAIRMDTSVKNMILILENYSQWALIQRNEISFNSDLVDLNDLILKSILYFEHLAAQKNISINYRFNRDYFVISDRSILFFILKNLLSNAIKFNMAGGFVNISVNELNMDNAIQIEVTDNGLGISPEKQLFFKENIPFSSLGNNHEKGHGLGLLICKFFIKKLQGKITILSEENRGTSIILKLPNSK